MSLHLWTHKSSANEKFLNPVFNWQLRIGCKLTLGFIPGLSFFQLALLKKKKMDEKRDTRAYFLLYGVTGQVVFWNSHCENQLVLCGVNDSCKTNKQYKPTTGLLFRPHIQLEDVFFRVGTFHSANHGIKFLLPPDLCCVTHTNKYFRGN